MQIELTKEEFNVLSDICDKYKLAVAEDKWKHNVSDYKKFCIDHSITEDDYYELRKLIPNRAKLTYDEICEAYMKIDMNVIITYKEKLHLTMQQIQDIIIGWI